MKLIRLTLSLYILCNYCNDAYAQKISVKELAQDFYVKEKPIFTEPNPLIVYTDLPRNMLDTIGIGELSYDVFLTNSEKKIVNIIKPRCYRSKTKEDYYTVIELRFDSFSNNGEFVYLFEVYSIKYKTYNNKRRMLKALGMGERYNRSLYFNSEKQVWAWSDFKKLNRF